MRETGIHAESERFVQSYKCSSGIFTQQGSTVVYKEKQINLYNMESVHTRILTRYFHSQGHQDQLSFHHSISSYEIGRYVQCWIVGFLLIWPILLVQFFFFLRQTLFN